MWHRVMNPGQNTGRVVTPCFVLFAISTCIFLRIIRVWVWRPDFTRANVGENTMKVKARRRYTLLSALLLLLGCEDSMTKADWLASESAPNDYPMEVISGTFLYPGDDHGLYVPDGKTVHHGWGYPVSTHVVGPDQKPLPDRLRITYYSYLEDQFYRGEFELPYESIVQMVNEGYPNHKTPPATMYYDELTVGMAPGGSVAVWLVGIGKTTEIFFGKAEPIDYDWKKYWSDAFMSDHPKPREQYVEKALELYLTPEQRKRLETEGIPFDKWERMRTHYHWQPEFFRMAGPDSPGTINYLNGELYHLRYPLTEEDAAKPRPLPKRMSFHSGKYLFIIHFDEDEMLSVFEKMAEGDNPLYLDIAPGIPRSETAIRVRNRDDEHIDLERFTVEEIN
ncbi:MAG: hypothetical protein CMG77_02535 [Marinimicrobium sp.]|nr:hypothetical protein [Marinimicrobium sp.]